MEKVSKLTLTFCRNSHHEHVYEFLKCQNGQTLLVTFEEKKMGLLMINNVKYASDRTRTAVAINIKKLWHTSSMAALLHSLQVGDYL